MALAQDGSASFSANGWQIGGSEVENSRMARHEQLLENMHRHKVRRGWNCPPKASKWSRPQAASLPMSRPLTMPNPMEVFRNTSTSTPIVPGLQ